MPLIDRSNRKDAQRQIEKFIPDRNIRMTVINFFAEMILHANGINRGNWNLNLDKGGQFLRFNTGQVYCITISLQGMQILCLKNILTKTITGKVLDIKFIGYLGETKTISHHLHETPDCLVKVPDSVGCILKHENVKEYLPLMREANRKFIDFAMRETTILPKMKNAHSSGSIEYLSEMTRKNIPNPYYAIEETEFQTFQEKLVRRAKTLTDRELEKEVSHVKTQPNKVNIVTSQYVRNPYIAEFVKRQAKGICQDCHQPAPFVSKKTGDPYLEPHHIIPLSEGGKDSIENVVALCPNCHRKRHYG